MMIIKIDNDYVDQIREGIEIFIKEYGRKPTRLRCDRVTSKLISNNQELKDLLSENGIKRRAKQGVGNYAVELDITHDFNYGSFSSTFTYNPNNFTTSYTASSGWNL